jgi:alkylated DNA repair dioxygenase AlkB
MATETIGQVDDAVRLTKKPRLAVLAVPPPPPPPLPAEYFTLLRAALPAPQRAALLAELQQLLPTDVASRSRVKVFGREGVVPRDQVMLSQGAPVAYRPLTPEVAAVLAWVNALWTAPGERPFDVVLVNGYNGDGPGAAAATRRDGVGWHADDELSIDATRPIVSVSVQAAAGETRDFDVRRKPAVVAAAAAGNASAETVAWRLALGDGDVLAMLPGTQSRFDHRVPPRARAGQRYNLTFRVYGGKAATNKPTTISTETAATNKPTTISTETAATNKPTTISAETTAAIGNLDV